MPPSVTLNFTHIRTTLSLLDLWTDPAGVNALFILQKKIHRIITFSWYDVSSQILFTDLNILPLYNLIQHRISFMMYKLVNGLLPEVMSELYTTNDQIHDHFTRQYHFFHINKGRSNVDTRSFGNVSPRI